MIHAAWQSQSFEGELKISCRSWFCKNLRAKCWFHQHQWQSLQISLETRWHSCVEKNALSYTAWFGSLCVLKSSLHSQDVKRNASSLFKWISLISGSSTQHLSCCSSQCKLWMFWSNYFWINQTIYSMLILSLKKNERDSNFNQNKIQKRKSITI